jgi:hypothetical protein
MALGDGEVVQRNPWARGSSAAPPPAAAGHDLARTAPMTELGAARLTRAESDHSGS